MVSTRTRSSAGVPDGGESSTSTGASVKVLSPKPLRPVIAPFDEEPEQSPNVAAGEGCSTLVIKSIVPKSLRPAGDKSPDHPDSVPPINLQQLPTEVLEKILSYLPYGTIGHLRIVSHHMDAVCGGVLNFKFQRIQTLMANRFQELKSKMPRRESARRSHPLACEADVIETLHMRLTLLQMTFGKHIERRHCCFFAGEILDECFRIINYVRITQKLSRPYKVTDELFDLSTMAMEYFKEQIEPTLPEIPYFNSSDIMDFSNSYASHSQNNFLGSMVEDTQPVASTSKPLTAYSDPEPAPGQSTMVLRNNIRRMKQGMRRYNNQLSIMRRDIRCCRSKIAEQQKQILEYNSRLDDHDKKSEENSRKCSTFLQELNKCKTELQYWRSKSPAIPPNCDACGHVFDIVLAEDLEAPPIDQELVPEQQELNLEENIALPMSPKKPDDLILKPVVPKEGKGKRKLEPVAGSSGIDLSKAGELKPKYLKLSGLKIKADPNPMKVKKPCRILLPRGKQTKN